MSDTNLLLEKVPSGNHHQTQDTTRCPACRASEVSLLFDVQVLDGPPSIEGINGKRHIYRCRNCSHAYASPGQEGELASYYESLSEEYHSVHDSSVARYRMVLNALDLSRTRRILDWGCGTGTFLSFVPETVDKFGLEPAKRAAEAAARTGIRILSRDALGSPEWNQTFDAVTVIDVIEHLSDPESVLLTVSRLLRPGGMMVLLTGDFDSWPARKAGRHWYYLHYAEHLSFFSGPSMRKWLENHFDHIAITRVTHHHLPITVRGVLWARYCAARCLETLGLAQRLRVSAKRFVTSDHMLVTAVRRAAQGR